MGNFLYLFAVVFVILWAIGYFAYSIGAIIHLLLILALISVLLRIIRGDKIIK
ncbi:MAG: lmo0937 family membrane protein [Bacteroidetes bacterium]|nr:MAG: lmo0937 family membrane protein [Bacteroidota bacterium]